VSDLNEPYAEPKVVKSIDDCYFYHTMDIPGHGVVEGQWDLRETLDDYSGRVDFSGRRVLEVGTASGLLCFYMERQGADVVAYDLSMDQAWDIVPYAALSNEGFEVERRAIIGRINNGFWFAHAAHGSRAKMVYGDVYNIPAAIGPVDIATFCSILLHVRDPFHALANALRLTRDTVVVTDLIGPTGGPPASQSSLTTSLQFLPDFRNCEPRETWWRLSPEVVQAFIGVLGFEDTNVTRHVQRSTLGDYELFTVVGHRTRGQAVSG
jgi:hypothetical protein